MTFAWPPLPLPPPPRGWGSKWLIRLAFFPPPLEGGVGGGVRGTVSLYAAWYKLTAQVIVSEIGTDMSRFPTAGHLISWAGLCPRNDESAGKRRSNRLRKGAPWLKTTLVQCAWAGARKKASYLNAQFHRLRYRRGPKKAICAVAASILTAAYHMLRDGTFYRDLGSDHFQTASPQAQVQRLASKIAKLGFICTITEAQTVEPVSV